MTEKHKTGLPGLHNLHKTLDAATEFIATFISVTRSDEKAPESLIEAADKAVIDLAGWRATMKQLMDSPKLRDGTFETGSPGTQRDIAKWKV